MIITFQRGILKKSIKKTNLKQIKKNHKKQQLKFQIVSLLKIMSTEKEIKKSETKLPQIC